MEPSERSSFTSLFIHGAAPNPVQTDNAGVVLNFPLTIPESMFLVFARSMIQTNLNEGNNLIYLGCSEPMQRGFNDWVAKTFANATFTPEDLNLTTLVASVWSKTKTYIENELTHTHEQNKIDDEREWQTKADTIQQDFLAQGRNGKVFTTRQSQWLITAADNLA